MTKERSFTDGKHGVALPVRIIPRATRNEIVEILSDQTVKIRIAAPPLDCKANEELIKFLSDILGIPKSNIDIVAGHTGRIKLISIIGVDSSKVHQKILEHLP